MGYQGDHHLVQALRRASSATVPWASRTTTPESDSDLSTQRSIYVESLSLPDRYSAFGAGQNLSSPARSCSRFLIEAHTGRESRSFVGVGVLLEAQPTALSAER